MLYDIFNISSIHNQGVIFLYIITNLCYIGLYYVSVQPELRHYRLNSLHTIISVRQTVFSFFSNFNLKQGTYPLYYFLLHLYNIKISTMDTNATRGWHSLFPKPLPSRCIVFAFFFLGQNAVKLFSRRVNMSRDYELRHLNVTRCVIYYNKR